MEGNTQGNLTICFGPRLWRSPAAALTSWTDRRKTICLCLWLLLSVLYLPALPIQPDPPPSPLREPLWKVRGEHNSVYLLGSVHCLKSSDYPLPTAILQAFSNAPVAVFETDFGKLQAPLDLKQLVDKSRLPPGQSLRAHLSSTTYERLKHYLVTTGLSPDIFDNLKPSIAAITLELLKIEQAGFNPDCGLDQYLFHRAQRADKQILSLESVGFQIDLFTDVSKNQGEFLMRTTLDSLDRTKDSLGAIVQAWRTGNADALKHLLQHPSAPDSGLAQRIVKDRNLSWLPQIEDMLRGEKDVIVVVGVGHLIGDQGMIALLTNRGWPINQE